MARSPANLLTAAALLGFPAAGLALGLGDIQLKSALNQPLDAQIEILGATPQDLRDLHASIAARETFARYGLEYPNMLSGFRFSVEKGPSGGDVLRVTSPQPVTEPFLTFLVEADWTRGRLLREYTVLLDPPVFMPEQPATAAVEAPRGASAQPAPGAGAIERPAAPAPATQAPARPRGTLQAPATQAAAEIENGAYRVRRGDTLWVIASRTRTDSSVSLNQMMVALYRNNPEAFLGNMNLVKEGSVLKVPSASELAAISSTEANAEFQRQAANWHGGAAPQPVEEAQLKLVPPKSGSEATGAESNVAPSASSAAAVAQAAERNAALSAQVDDLEGQLADAQRLLAVKDAELAKLQSQLAAAPAAAAEPAEPVQSEPTQAGVDLESGQSEPVAGTSEESPVESAPVESEPEAATPSPAAEAAPTPEAATTAAQNEPESGSWLDALLGIFKHTWVWVAAGLALLLAAMGVALKQRRSALTPLEALDEDAEDEVEATTRIAEPPPAKAAAPAAAPLSKPRVAPVLAAAPPPPPSTADTGTFEITGTFRPVDFDTGADQETADSGSYLFEDSGSALAIDQADPISEADFHMAYGLYDQASELIKKALEREPGKQELQLKLLEILFVWGNKDGFRERAQAFRADLTRAGEWDKIVIMGKQICAGDPLFEGGGTPADSGVDLDLAASGRMSAPGGAAARTEDTHTLDFDLDDALTAKADLHAAETVPATGEYLEIAHKEEAEEVEVHDEQLTAVARRLEARMRPRAGDVGVALDLGETIAPEDVSSTRTLAESKERHADDEAFGDFFAFTGVAEAPEPDPTGTREIVLDFEGDMLPDSTTAEFKIELPEDGGDVDLDLGATGAHLPRLDGDTTTMLAPGGGDTTVVSNFGDTETMQAPGFVDPTARTVQAPMPGVLGGDFDLISSSDETVSANSLDLDIGGGESDQGDAERGGTARVSPAELALPDGDDGVLDEVGTKLDLARAYIDMGDPDGARSILEEVIEEGDESQRENAHTLLRSIA